MKIVGLIFVLNLISFPLFASISWVGNYFCIKGLDEALSSDPLVISETDTLHFFVSVYKPEVTEGEGQGAGIQARFYIDVPRGLYFPMQYVRDEGHNDVYGLELKPLMLQPGPYRFGIAVSDEPISKNSHWSEGNFYWVTKTSYGYTNPSYPNHEWIHSFRTLEVTRGHFLPFLENKK